METAILAICICCVVFTRTGILLYLSGSSRSRHAASAAVRCLCDLAVSAICFWAIGGAILLHSRNPYLGLDVTKLLGDQMTVLFTLAMVLVGTGPAVGAIAERGRFVLVPPLAVLLSVIVIPIVGHWTWYGLLAKFGGVDIGGALPIILAPAVVGIVAAAMVGPRSNKYNRDGSANAIPGHNAVLAAGGIGLLLAGWLAYLVLAAFVWANVGLWRTLLDGILAACAGMLGAMVFGAMRYGRSELPLVLVGVVAGLASSTAGVGMMPPWAAVLAGASAGVLGSWAAAWVDVRWRIDDVSGLNAALIASSAISLLITPLVVGVGWSGKLGGLGANAIGIAIGITLAGLCAWLLLSLIKRVTKLRVSEADEFDGLDLAEHDQNAYPDFQQNMIKSYHLRET